MLRFVGRVLSILQNFLPDLTDEFLVNRNLNRSGSSGEVDAVQTSKNTIFSKKAVVMAAGCWTGTLMHELIKSTNIKLDIPVKPRKVRIRYVMQI